jgi:uroporphyrinogen-III decarboxylase
MDNKWSGLTREQKRLERMAKYLSGEGVNFRDAVAQKMYRERAARISNAMMCRKPDRVPVNLPSGFFPAYYAGYNLKRVMNDYQAMEEAWMRFLDDFNGDTDTFSGPAFIFSARALEILDYKSYKWPGHGLGDDVNTFQFVEEAYMRADEYDYLLKDPSDFAFRVMVPREVGCLAPLEKFPALHGFMSMPMTIAYPFTNPKTRAAFQCLIEAGAEIEKLQKHVMKVARAAVEAGFPPARGGLGVAPFDVIADFLRGTEGSVLDMYRQPEKLLEAIDMITEMTIKRIVSGVNASGGFVVNFPLHKGDDTFMSNKQFEKFYWPSLKKVIDSLIDEGIMASLFAEGRYNQRLEYIGEFPKGWVQWQFDQTDMASAKKMIGDNCCISGNVPASVILTGTARDVKESCRRLIETCAPGGGYILSGGATATEARPENLKAFMEAAKEYGVYKK